MDAPKLAAAVLSEFNDHLSVTPYGHGYLISLPLYYFDGDRVKLFIEPFENGFRVTDRGMTLMRLNMADLNPQSARVADAWNRSVAHFGLYSFGTESGQIAAWGAEDELGALIIRVAEASIRIDQLRWLAQDRKPGRFPDRVVRKLIKSVDRAEDVLPQAPLPQRSGRTRRVTAAVGLEPENRMYIQAVGGGSNKDAQEKSVEHCFYLFQLADQVPRKRRLAVASGHREDWPRQIIEELAVVSDVAFFDESAELEKLLQDRFASL